MGFPQRQAAIVGVYTTEQARFLERTSVSLQLEAIKGALADAGLTTADVDGVIPFDNTAYSTAPFPAQVWAAQFGGRPMTFAERGSPTTGVPRAAMAIAAGYCDVAVAFWGKAGWKLGPGGTAVPDEAPRVAEFLPILDRQLEISRFVGGAQYSVADITALVAIDFMKPAKLAVPLEHRNIARWQAEVSARPSTKA